MLRAKSPYKVGDVVREKGLADHCQDVMDAFSALFGSRNVPSRLGKIWLRFFKLNDEDFPKFYDCGVAACGLHDVGKANDRFQALVEPGKKQGTSQVLRHEHLSGLLLVLPEIWDWLKAIPNLDTEIVLSAVIAHHLKAKQEEFASLPVDQSRFMVFAEDWEFQKVFSQVGSHFGGKSFSVKVEQYWTLDGTSEFDGGRLVENIRRTFHRLKHTLKKQPERHRLLMAIRAGVILADAAGSGLPRNDLKIIEWIEKQFPNDKLLTGEDINQKIITPRIQYLEATKKIHFEPKDFQKAAVGLPERSLILAGCGSGKTIAAWYWIQARLHERPTARVIFLYPTRATATEGFRDYVSWAPEAEAALISGTSAYELEGMFEQPDDERRNKDFTVEQRLYALAFWQRRIFSATVDQFLGFMQHAYSSVCLMPVLADSVVVIDEVHSFDRALFSVLKTFLEHFNVPVLCMTASLPSRRRDDLINLGLTVFPGKERFAELDALASHPRYRVQFLDSKAAAVDIAQAAFEKGKRVLWVVNTVDRCQELAQSLRALCYHSRFKLDDRKERHNEVVRAFQESDKPVIALTTQVCEMSLDLDANVLISESAPITSLIQRMGRCNRHAESGDEKRGEVYIYAAEFNAPYKDEDLYGVTEFIQSITGQDVSQQQLEELLEKLGPKEPEKSRLCHFTEDGPWASSEPLREIDTLTSQAVLDRDVELYLQRVKNKQPVEGMLLPVPPKLGEKDPRLGHYILRAPSRHYSPKFGFFKDPLSGGFEIC